MASLGGGTGRCRRALRLAWIALSVAAALTGLVGCGAPGPLPPAAAANTSTPPPLPSRAFWRGGQVWVSLHGGNAGQATHIAYPPAASGDAPVPGPLRWSPGGRYLAFSYAFAADTPGFARLGLLDTITGSVTYPNVPGMPFSMAGDSASITLNVAVRGGYGWSDVTTLVVAGPATSQSGGQQGSGWVSIYTVDATSGAASPISGLRVVSIGGLVVREGAFYYSKYIGEPDAVGSVTATLHRFDIVGHTDQTLVSLGSVGLALASGAPPVVGAFDISADGTRMVYQRIDAFDATSGTSVVSSAYVLAATDGSSARPVLAGLAADQGAMRVELALSPVGSQVAAATPALVATDSASGGAYHVLTPADVASGAYYSGIVWSPNGASFTMDRFDNPSAPIASGVYTVAPAYGVYLAGDEGLAWWPTIATPAAAATPGA